MVVSRRSSSEKHLAQHPNALLTRLDGGLRSLGSGILNVITERIQCASSLPPLG